MDLNNSIIDEIKKGTSVIITGLDITGDTGIKYSVLDMLVSHTKKSKIKTFSSVAEMQVFTRTLLAHLGSTKNGDKFIKMLLSGVLDCNLVTLDLDFLEITKLCLTTITYLDNLGIQSITFLPKDDIEAELNSARNNTNIIANKLIVLRISKDNETYAISDYKII